MNYGRYCKCFTKYQFNTDNSISILLRNCSLTADKMKTKQFSLTLCSKYSKYFCLPLFKHTDCRNSRMSIILQKQQINAWRSLTLYLWPQNRYSIILLSQSQYHIILSECSVILAETNRLTVAFNGFILFVHLGHIKQIEKTWSDVRGSNLYVHIHVLCVLTVWCSSVLEKRQKKIQRERLITEFSNCLGTFQRTQRDAARKEKEFVARVRASSRVSVSRRSSWKILTVLCPYKSLKHFLFTGWWPGRSIWRNHFPIWQVRRENEN